MLRLFNQAHLWPLFAYTRVEVADKVPCRGWRAQCLSCVPLLAGETLAWAFSRGFAPVLPTDLEGKQLIQAKFRLFHSFFPLPSPL